MLVPFPTGSEHQAGVGIVTGLQTKVAFFYLIKSFLPTFFSKAPCPPLDLHIEALIVEPTSKLKAGQENHLCFAAITLESIPCIFSNCPKNSKKYKKKNIY